MQPTKRKRLTQKLNTSIDWILNLIDAFPKQELEESNMRVLSEGFQSRLQEAQLTATAQIYTYNQQKQKFTKTTFKLFTNMLIQLPLEENGSQQYLILSSCSLEKKILQYKEFQAFGLILYSRNGQCFLFFEQDLDLIELEWYKMFKKYCIMNNFLNKYTIRERQAVQNVFACVKNKNSRVYAVEVFRLQDLQKGQGFQDCLMNEVNILMNFKHPSLLTFLRQYEDKQHIYLLYEFWVGDPLYKLILSGYRMQIAQMANVIYQIIKLLKVLHQEQIYHGAITPQNIIVMRSPNNIQKVTLKSFSYREKAVASNYQWLAKRLPPKWVPPELIEERQNYDPLKFDSYLLGCTLYYMMTFNPGLRSKEMPFMKSVEGFMISQEEVQKLQRGNYEEQQMFGASQLGLLLGLLDPDPDKRMSIQDASKHHWFVKQKSKLTGVHKDQILPSLKTILELRESESFEHQSHRLGMETSCVGMSMFQESESEYSVVSETEHDNVHRYTKEESYLYIFMSRLQGIKQIKHPRTTKIGIDII